MGYSRGKVEDIEQNAVYILDQEKNDKHKLEFNILVIN